MYQLADFVRFGAQIPTAIGVVMLRECLKHHAVYVGMMSVGVSSTFCCSFSKWARVNTARRCPGA